MDLRKRFGNGLRRARKSKGLSQEAFSIASSRTYLSSLERGIKYPTIEKVEQLADTIGIHPVTLLALAYVSDEDGNITDLCSRMIREIQALSQPDLA